MPERDERPPAAKLRHFAAAVAWQDRTDVRDAMLEGAAEIERLTGLIRIAERERDEAREGWAREIELRGREEEVTP